MKPTSTLPAIAASAAGHRRGGGARDEAAAGAPGVRLPPGTEPDSACLGLTIVKSGVASMLSGTILQVLGVLVVVGLVITLLVRPGSFVALLLAVGVVIAAVVVSWHDVEQYRAQRAANAAIQQQNAAAAASAPAPQPNPAPTGS
ncbi:MAG TPA: hypothetical protein VMB84_08080 [Stellaceae bacterium]|nr:hypothetical protein [Stellaceae bacterium]